MMSIVRRVLLWDMSEVVVYCIMGGCATLVVFIMGSMALVSNRYDYILPGLAFITGLYVTTILVFGIYALMALPIRIQEWLEEVEWAHRRETRPE